MSLLLLLLIFNHTKKGVSLPHLFLWEHIKLARFEYCEDSLVPLEA